MSKYAIPVNQGTMDLIAHLAGGMRPDISTDENNPNYLVVEVDPAHDIVTKVQSEDDLHDEHGVGDPDTVWLLGS